MFAFHECPLSDNKRKFFCYQIIEKLSNFHRNILSTGLGQTQNMPSDSEFGKMVCLIQVHAKSKGTKKGRTGWACLEGIRFTEQVKTKISKGVLFFSEIFYYHTHRVLEIHHFSEML